MSHEVVWDVAAFRILSRIWEAAFDREPIAHALDEIQEMLSSDASSQGESREQGLRIVLVPPLGVKFWANDRTTEVVIVDVWQFRERN